jgi:3-oxoacyl-[acyl-carrier protein] reductase
MNEKLQGKRVVITGGTRGIGFAIAGRLLEAGCGVLICGRTEQGIERALSQFQLTSSYKISGIVADVSQYEDVVRLFRRADSDLGGVDVLINNAGIGIFQPAGEMSIENWKHTIDTNLTGAFFCSREAIPRMKAAGGGYIVNMSSLAGANAFAGGAAYNASKFGMNGFSEAMMFDHRYDNIRVTYIMPGSVDTEFSPRSREGKNTNWKIDPGDVADMVVTVLGMPDRTLVSRVEIRPSKPAK